MNYDFNIFGICHIHVKAEFIRFSCYIFRCICELIVNVYLNVPFGFFILFFKRSYIAG